MSRAEEMRVAVRRLLEAQPFERFAINLENGDRIVIEDPHAVSLPPSSNGSRTSSMRFNAFAKGLEHYGSFEAVTSVAKMHDAPPKPKHRR